MTANGSVMIKLWTVPDDNNDVVRAIPSPDLTIFAAFCKDSPKVYILDLNAAGSLKTELNYTGDISSIRWRDTTSQLAITGGDSNTETFFVLYDYLKQTEEDLSDLAQSLVLDVAFSPDGNIIYFIEDASITN